MFVVLRRFSFCWASHRCLLVVSLLRTFLFELYKFVKYFVFCVGHGVHRRRRSLLDGRPVGWWVILMFLRWSHVVIVVFLPCQACIVSFLFPFRSCFCFCREERKNTPFLRPRRGRREEMRKVGSRTATSGRSGGSEETVKSSRWDFLTVPA